MTKDELSRANELNKTLEILNEAQRIMAYPYFEIDIFKEKLFFALNYKREKLHIDSVQLDTTTRERLRKAIKEVLSKRYDEIYEELKKI